MGLFEKIFGKKTQPQNNLTAFQLLNSFVSTFTPFEGGAWADDKVRAAVDSFARRAAVVRPKHVRKNDGKAVEINDSINRVLQFKPNPYNTAYSFYYRMAANYKVYHCACAFPIWDDITGELKEIYNINAPALDLKEKNGELFVLFRFANGRQYALPFTDVVFIGTHYLDNEIFGDGNKPLLPVLETAHTFNQSMSKFAELVAIIRGTLEVQGSVKNEDLRKRREEFIRDNLALENNGSGVIVTDSRYKYTPMSEKTTPIPDKQLEYIKSSIQEYFGTNDKIIKNQANAEEENSFYIGELQPFFVQLSQAMTNCLFTKKERGYGNEIVADINTLELAKLPERLNAVKFLAEIGALTIDQALTTIGYPPIGGEEGSRRVQTLNVVNAAKADEYQLGAGSDTDPPPKDPAEDGEPKTPGEGEGEE